MMLMELHQEAKKRYANENMEPITVHFSKHHSAATLQRAPVQISNQPITGQQFKACRHVDGWDSLLKFVLSIRNKEE